MTLPDDTPYRFPSKGYMPPPVFQTRPDVSALVAELVKREPDRNWALLQALRERDTTINRIHPKPRTPA